MPTPQITPPQRGTFSGYYLKFCRDEQKRRRKFRSFELQLKLYRRAKRRANHRKYRSYHFKQQLRRWGRWGFDCLF